MTAQQNKQKSSRFLASFHYFRGISILIIVAGHCFYLLEWQPRNFVEETFFNFFVGGTALFVFISGFLFHHIFYENFKFKKFLNSKLRNILLPYLFMSILPITLEIVRDGGQSDLKT